MIFSLDQLHDSGSVFHGNGGDPLEWTSRLPDLSVFGFGADPALAADLWNGHQVAKLAMRNVASALRLASGRVAITQGFVTTQLPVLSGLFNDSLDTLYGGIDLASKVLGTEAFTKALDSLGWIPIAGWVIGGGLLIWDLVEGGHGALPQIAAALTSPEMADTTRSLAMMMPVRSPGSPNLDRLIHRIILSFQTGLASVKMMWGKGVP